MNNMGETFTQKRKYEVIKKFKKQCQYLFKAYEKRNSKLNKRLSLLLSLVYCTLSQGLFLKSTTAQVGNTKTTVNVGKKYFTINQDYSTEDNPFYSFDKFSVPGEFNDNINSQSSNKRTNLSNHGQIGRLVSVDSMVSPGQNLKDRLDNIVNRNHVLANNAMDFWNQKGPDQQNGGFYSIIDENGVGIDSTKFIIQQIRYLWTCSMWYSTRESTPNVQNICHELYSFIVSSFRDPQTGNFYYSVNKDGSQIENEDRMSYADAFVIYGLSEYANAFKNQEALDIAMQVYEQLNGRAYDNQNKGYDQSNDDRIWFPLGEKGTNTQLHILEAFTRLYQVSGDLGVKQKLYEMVQIFTDKIIQDDNYCAQYFYADWTPAEIDNHIISYGHDLETVWLLLEAVKVLELEDDTVLINKIIDMGKRSSKEGYDAAVGAFNNRGDLAGAVVDDTKVWWIQFESIQGIWQLYLHTKDEKYLSQIESILDWLENQQMHRPIKEWFKEVDNSGTPGQNRYIADEWKTNYHSIRASVNMANWVGDYIRELVCSD